MDEREKNAQVAGDALEQALMRATATVERELARIVKAGEDDLDRLARKIAETLAQLAIDGVIGGVMGETGSSPRGEGGAASLNGLAAALAKAARRGARFT
jgi:hypothetical protein